MASVLPEGISSEILMPHGRIARKPIVRWAESLHTLLDTLPLQDKASPALHQAIGGVANSTALLYAHIGDRTRARALCEIEIGWAAATAGTYRDPQFAWAGVQPWINLGRLLALEGQWEEALRQFWGLAPLLSTESTILGPLILHRGHFCPDSCPDPTLEAFDKILAVLVIDSARTLIASGQTERLGTYLESCPIPVSHPLREIVSEVEIIRSAVAGDFELAMTRAARGAQVGSLLPRAVYVLRFAEALNARGERDAAHEAAGKLARSLARLPVATWPTVPFALIAGRAASLAAATGAVEPAVSLARVTYDAAVKLNDEVLVCQMLAILAAANADVDGQPAAERQARLRTETSYKRLGATAAARELAAATLHPLYTRLTELMSM